ncbi:SAM-dependent methyltransferase [Mycobacterium asiaticum]|uniref:S-adenosyl-L-methionine-dependent methyltransferase n=1 Tax=Mycobacterium asiaticum TaxID=1790 RepID=A0A1A3MZ55_MYCAS|nr:SAM-dependent methyltransferase [Mycobacterium asiaticum]OBK15193.1 SAM-dependent methyltransferase [Mycobacterium asiaticum]
MASSGSTRHEGDSWDLASSVGVTATMVAAARAMATRADNPLVEDRFAEPLVRAVGLDVLTRLAAGEITAADLDDDPERPFNAVTTAADNMAVRTKFFDEFFLDAARAGITQAVILASRLDSRAYRLAWPAGTVVYEIDQPQVTEFKSRTLAELGAQPTADLRTVSVDLRDDWPAALRAAGFDAAQPTAWSAEGLLGYLPPDAQDRLLDTVTKLSALGSRFATESMNKVDGDDQDRLEERMRDVSERWHAHGLDLNMTELVYFGDRNEVAAYLTDRGWLMTSIPLPELRVLHGLSPEVEDDVPAVEMLYISGTLYKTH